MSEFQIRQALPREYAAIGELTVGAYQGDGYLGADPDTGYATVLRDVASRVEHGEVLAAVDASGEVLGSLTIVRPGSRYAEVSQDGELEFRMLAVSAAARRRGVGEALTRAVLDRARALRLGRVVLCSLYLMTPAHRLYERLGFTRLEARDWEPEPGIRLLAYGIEV